MDLSWVFHYSGFRSPRRPESCAGCPGAAYLKRDSSLEFRQHAHQAYLRPAWGLAQLFRHLPCLRLRMGLAIGEVLRGHGIALYGEEDRGPEVRQLGLRP